MLKAIRQLKRESRHGQQQKAVSSVPEVVLTAEQIDEFRAVFSQFDKDGSGTIDSSELGDAMRSLGQNPSALDIQEMMQEVDADASGAVDFNEFLSMMKSKLQDGDNEEDIYEALQVFTANRKGNKVDADRLKTALTTIGEVVSEQDVDFVFKSLTIDNDGFIDCRELSSILAPPQPKT